MAAVTVNSKKFNVSGSLLDRFYNITGNSGDTLDVGMYNVQQVVIDPNVITSYAVAGATPQAGMSRITFTGGPFTAANVQVLGT